MIARYGDTDYGYSEAGYGYGVSAFTGFDGLSIIPDTLGWWSVSRRVLSRYNGPLFRARRSTDSAERDWFGTGPQGEVNIAEFQSWCSGGNAFAVTLYDQSGLARNFAQSTTTIQPILAESGTAITENGRLAAKFVAADARRMSIASSTAMFNALHSTGGSVLIVSRYNDTVAAKTLLTNQNANAAIGLRLTDGSAELVSAAVANGVEAVLTAAKAEAGTTALNVLVWVLDPDNATAASREDAWRNGTLLTGDNVLTATPSTSNAATDLVLGARAAGTNPHDGTISEIAAFSALISTADRTTWQSRSGNFYGVTIS